MSNGYALAPELREIIAEEKVRLNVNLRNHEWRVLASVAKRMESPPVGNSDASSSSPAGRTRNRTSLTFAEIRVIAPGLVSAAPPASVRKQSLRKVRYSDPGPLLPQSGLSSSATATHKRRSIGTPSNVSRLSSSTPVATPSRRRRSIAPSRSHRRHTFAAASTRQQFASPTPEAISQEIQFFPLKQALSARTRRALRRNALSEEMNNIDEEKRAGLTKNRIELIKLRRELAESSDRLRELERELAAARHAPSEEPEPLPPIDEEQDEDFNMSFPPDNNYQRQCSVSPARSSPALDEPRMASVQADEAPVPNLRDQKIKDLESMIQSLRDDIAQRAEEERLRAQEDEVFHDAEEQIMHEENYALAERIEELTAIKAKKVSFDNDTQDLNATEEDGEYMGPFADDVDDNVTDTEGEHATLRPFGISLFSQVEDDARAEKIAGLEVQNDQLRETIETLGAKIQDIEAELGETQMNVDERERAFNKLKRENEKSRRLEKELELKITELEEMEGERLEAVGDMMVQTDEVVDQERIVMEEKIDSLTEQVVELQDMIRAVTIEKQETEAIITAAGLQVTSLQAAVESSEASKLEANSQVHALTIQIADLRVAISEEHKKSEDIIKDANAQITDLQRIAEAGEAARLSAEAKILTVTNQAKELESIVSEERSEVEIRISRLEATVEAGKLTRIDAESQIATLKGQIQEREILISEVKAVSQAQIADLQLLVEAGKVARAQSEARILTLLNQAEDLEASITKQRSEAEAIITAGNSQIAALRDTVEAGEAAKAKIEAQILELNSQIDGLKTDVSDLAKEKEEMQKEIEVLREKVEELETEIWELREENVEMRQEMTILEQRSKESESATNILRNDKAGLEKQLEILETKVVELEDAAQVLTKAKASLETEFVTLNTQLFAQQTTAGLAETTLETFKHNIVELHSHIGVLEQAADSSKSERESFERDINSLRARVLSLENDQKLAKEESLNLQRNIDGLNAQISSFEQAIEAADQENQRQRDTIADSNSQIEVLNRAVEIVNQQKESLELTLINLNRQLSELCKELDVFRDENNLFKQKIVNQKSEIESLKELLELSNQEKDGLHQHIQRLGDKVESLENVCMNSNERTRDLQSDIETLHAEIKSLKQASVIAEEEKSIIQQKIRPYIQSEQSLDMAVEEVLTELVMAKNRADENERIKNELSNKIRILAQNDDCDAESINPVEMVERLTDCFKEVRHSVEKLYESRGQTAEGPFEGYNLGDFAWTGSNESSLAVLGRLVGDMCVKVTSAQTQAQESREGWEQEKEQRRVYGTYLEDIATTVGDRDQEPPKKDQTLRLVTQRLLTLKGQIDAAEEKVEGLNDSVARQDNTIKDLETNIDNGCRREVELNQKLVSSISAYDATTALLGQAQTEMVKLEKIIDEKDQKIGGLGAMIEQQAASYKNAVTELKQERDKAVADVVEQLANLQKTKADVEQLANKANEENMLVVKTLQAIVVASQAEFEETSQTLKATKVSHQEIVEKLEGRLAQSRGEFGEVSRKLRETIEKSSDDILALETKLGSSEDDVRRQKSSLDEAVAEQANTTEKFNAEIQNNHNAIAALEKKVQVIQAQHEEDQKAITSLETDLQTTRNAAEEEKNSLQEKIHSQVEHVNELEGQIDGLKKLVQEVEDCERTLEEQLKATESQSQLFQEEASKAHQALQTEKMALQQELADLKLVSETVQTKMEADAATLRILVEEKSQRIQELEAIVSTLRGEKSELEQTFNELDDMFEVEQAKNAETLQNMANEATKFMARIGDVKNHRLRQAEGFRNRRKRAREEQEAEESVYSTRMPPTPASSVIASAIELAKKRDSKRRKYDSGVGVEEDDEEFEGISQVGA